MRILSLKCGFPCARQFILCIVATALYGCGSSGDEQQDPFVEDIAIAYVQRQVPSDEDSNLVFRDAREPYAFHAGAALYLKPRASATAEIRNLTAGVFAAGETYDVKDLETSFDGSKLLFAMRAPEIPDADDEDQPTWNIWEYNLETDNLHRIISSDLQAEAGQDFDPHYLADGRIVFSSTRQRDINAIRLDEGKPQFSALDERRNVHAAVLHVMDADGTHIRQISYNMSHDMAPSLLEDGRILFSRWDNLGGRNQVNLYTSNPDGSGLQLLYGSNSHDQGTGDTDIQFLQAKQQPDGRLLVEVAPYNLETWGSSWQIIDTSNFTDHDVNSYQGNGESAEASLFPFTISTEDELSAVGRYLDVSNLWDDNNRYLVVWNPCRLREPGAEAALDETAIICTDSNINSADATEASPNSGLWVYDANENTQRPVSLPPPGQMITEAVALTERPTPTWIADTTDSDDSYGYLSIKSVYDVDGVDGSTDGITTLRDPLLFDYNQTPARFIRIIKGVGIPDRDTFAFNTSAFGPSGQSMREILGYAPVEPDGSVHVRVPANVPFTLAVVDAEGERIGRRHNVWLQVRPGETLHCTGCHNATSDAPHGRLDAQPPSVNPGAPADGEAFPNTDDSRLAIFAETMADTRARVLAPRELGPDLVYEDDWTDENKATKTESINLSFQNTVTPEESLETEIPVSSTCLASWESFCRTIIHYETHIQPIWDKPRQVLDTDGVTVLEDYTCSTCHDRTDAMGQLQVPPAQLELTDRSSEINSRYLISYTELLVRNLEQEIVEGVLRNREEEVPVLDENNQPVVDENDIPVTEIINFPLTLTMSSAGAANSSRFFDTFTDASDPIHFNRLTPIELKLLREWLDIGAQYYNNPFDAP